MNRTHHAVALVGTLFSTLAAQSPENWAHLAAAFSGVACGLFYSAKAAAVIRDKFFNRPKQ